VKLTIAGFAGANKALHPRLLPDTVGQDSQNQKPGRGDLRPWKDPLGVATVPTGRQTIYRFGRDVVSDADYWFSWTTVVHAVRGYNAEDTSERTYFTGSGAPKWTDNTIALAGAPYPTATRQLGVPAPATAVTLAAAGGVAAETEVRLYVVTYVTNIGEESMPSPVSLPITCKTDDTVTISNIPAAPGGSFTIDRVRVYRTDASASTAAFLFLREIAAGVASTQDDNRALGEPLQTATWEMPPSGLSYLTAMWNGMLAGITPEGAVRVCEPFAPYAWPPEYEIIPPDAAAKALGRWQQNLLVLTSARPLLVVGTSPESLDQQPLDFAEACVAPQGVVSFGHGVAWPCPDGLAYLGTGGPRMLTAGIFTRDDWRALNPSTMVAGQYEGAYLCFYTDGGGVRRGFLIDPINPAGVYFLETGYTTMFFDELQDALYVYHGDSGAISKWDAGAAFMTATFKSKVYVGPSVNYSACSVQADAFPLTLHIDAGPFTPAEVAAIVAATPALVANGAFVRYTKNVTSDEAFRLPSGFEATDWQVTTITGVPVQSVVLATSMEELE
jgi:hypothetical protein